MAYEIPKMSIFITHTSMEVHMTETLQKGEEELLRYSEIVQV